jgi:CBS domain containing-hemolysin-like protein
VRPFALVRSDDALHETLEKLQRRGAHMARVVDAAGETVGVATLEDVIEELVGEIRDSAHLGAHLRAQLMAQQEAQQDPSTPPGVSGTRGVDG